MEQIPRNPFPGKVAVLIVENEESQALSVQEFLSELPIEKLDIQHADRLSKALEKISGQPFDLVLLDLNLPDGQGPIVYREIRRAAGPVPVIILGDFEMSVYGADLIRMGAFEYLVKGQMSSEQLREAVRRCLGEDAPGPGDFIPMNFNQGENK